MSIFFSPQNWVASYKLSAYLEKKFTPFLRMRDNPNVVGPDLDDLDPQPVELVESSWEGDEEWHRPDQIPGVQLPFCFNLYGKYTNFGFINY